MSLSNICLSSEEHFHLFFPPFISLLLQNIDDIRSRRRTKVPMFDLESGARTGLRELEVSEDCGVVCQGMSLF